VTLLGRARLVILQNGVDHAQPRPQLRPPDRQLPLITRRHRIRSILSIVFRASPNSRATARRLLPSTRTARRTRAYSSTVYIPPVSHGKHGSSMAANLVRHPSQHILSVKPESGGGLLLLRHVTPLSRRHMVYFCSGAHIPAIAANLHEAMLIISRLPEYRSHCTFLLYGAGRRCSHPWRWSSWSTSRFGSVRTSLSRSHHRPRTQDGRSSSYPVP